MLYEFHRNENAKKSGSLRATYVVAGIPVSDELVKSAINGNKSAKLNGEDAVMQSSPFLSSAPETTRAPEISIPRYLYLLAREEDLDGKP
jgi:DNA polymerase delta subunit 3